MLLAALVPTLAAGAPAAAAGPTDYTREREWVYSPTRAEFVTGFAVDAQNQVYVSGRVESRSSLQRVRVYDTAGTELRSWDLRLPDLTAIEPDGAGNLLIAHSTWNGDENVQPSLQRWTSDGRHLQTATVPNPHEFNTSDIARAADGTIWVSDGANDVIHRFSPDLQYQGRIGSSGTGPGQFDNPSQIDTLPNGNLVVVDLDNKRVQIITPDGTPVAAWGQYGAGPGQDAEPSQFYGQPKSVRVRDDGYIYVTDSRQSTPVYRIMVFGQSGQYVGEIPLTGVETLTLAFGPDGALYGGGQMYLGSTGERIVANAVLRYVPSAPAGTPPGDPPPGDPPRQPGKKATAKVLGSKKAIRVGRRGFTVRVRCTGKGRCTGSLRTKVRGRTVTKPARYSIKAGTTKRVTVRPTKRGLRTLQRRRAVSAKIRTANATTTIRLRYRR